MEIQKAQKAPKEKKKKHGTVVAADKVGFCFPRKKLVFREKNNFFLGKSWFWESLCS